MTEFILYGRPGRHPCETRAAAQAARLRSVGVDHDPEIERRHGARIPVRTLDGEEVCYSAQCPAQRTQHLS